MSDHEYFLRRAAEELAAAERATCREARRVHHDLANRYLLKIEDGPSVPESRAPARRERLSA
jgi:hypothetical protein